MTWLTRLARAATIAAAATLPAGAHVVTAPAQQEAFAAVEAGPLRPGDARHFTATAHYCLKGITRAGTRARPGVLAADPALLPMGSIVRLEWPGGSLEGVYSVLDSGPAVTGDAIEIFMPDCGEAAAFGRQPVHLRVLRAGWSPTGHPETHAGFHAD